ncbi:hypothetical protein [Borrelia persica]|uniref:hypothetical protein n=1 Tax=Borrelia persica TaxID=44448 RepID=UPI0004641813|nr:hypothetical protein [Borrelia persica]
MRFCNLVRDTLIYNLGGVLESRIIRKTCDFKHNVIRKVFDLKHNVNSGGMRVKQSFNISDEDQIFYTLKARVIAYREEINGLHSQFDLGRFFLSIPFKKISPDFSDSYKQEKIYSSLGYDVEIIKQLGYILNRLDFHSPHFINIDADFAHKLLVLLNNITDYARTLVNYYLSDDNLMRIRFRKDKLRITEIYNRLEEFIAIRENCISKIKLQITYLSSKIARESILSGIKEMIDCEGEVGQAVNSMSTVAVTIWSLS